MQLAALMHSSSTSSSSYSTSSTSSSSSSQPLDLPSNAGARGPVPDSQVYCFRDGGVFAADVVPQLDVDLLRDPIIKVSGNLLLTRSGRLFDLSSNPPVERELPEPAIQTRSGAGGPGNVDRPRSAKACAGSYLMISQSGLLSSWSVEHPEKPLLVLLPDRSFSKIACGTAHCLAISRTGQVYSWGQGRHGELGHGDRVSACPSPQVVRSLQYIPALKIACGRHHSLALTRDNRAVYSWGCGDEGRLGLGEARNQWEPRHITRLEEEVARIAAGGFHSAAITTSGHLYTWGSGKFGQLGHLNQKDRLLPTVVEALSALRIVRVACDMLYSAVVSADGNIHTFGFGMAASTNSPEEYTLLQIAPVPRRLLTNKHIVKIGAGNLLIAVPGRIIGMSSSIPIDL
ncbi:MAG: hypothetical protein Q8P67_20730 [archaeon]|nr:hypothetical protein [archaeon]